MNNTVVNFREKAAVLANRSYHAEVLETENSEATNIYLPSLNREVNVYGHSDSVPPLSIGDMVLVECIDSKYIVTHRLRTRCHVPQCNLSLRNDGFLEVKNDGKVLIDGSMIYSSKENQNQFQDTIIELN